jgi:hypothetical protein
MKEGEAMKYLYCPKHDCYSTVTCPLCAMDMAFEALAANPTVATQHESYLRRHPELAREIDEQKKQDTAEVNAFLESLGQ